MAVRAHDVARAGDLAGGTGEFDLHEVGSKVWTAYNRRSHASLASEPSHRMAHRFPRWLRYVSRLALAFAVLPFQNGPGSRTKLQTGDAMYIVGDIGGGRIGNLSKDQALAWVLSKDGRT